MTEEDMEALEPLAGPELERMLARYARVRLEPSQAQARRARAAVMEEAWRRHLDPQSMLRTPAPNARVAAATATAHARHLPFRGWGPRRLGVAFAAAALAGLLLGSSVFAASRAGGPLYESRLALESLTLPADPSARATAQLAQADARLGEAVEAGFRHDDRAVAAALDAYDRTIAQLSTAGGPTAARALDAIQQHRAVLVQLAAQVPDTAASGIDTALENSDRVIVRLAESGAGGPGAGNDNGNGSPGNGNGSGTGGNGAAGGAGGAGNGGASGGAGGNGNGNGGSGNGNGHGNGGSGNGNGNGNTGGSTPAAGTPAPTAAPTEHPTPHQPDRTPKPHRTPPDATPTPARDAASPSD